MLGFKGLLVDTHDDGHIGAVRGGGYDHSLCSGLEMLCGSLAPGEDTGAFERDIDPELAPGQLRRITFGRYSDLASADIHPTVAGRDLARKMAVHAVISEEVCIGLDRPQIVDPDDLDFSVLVLVGCPQDQPADAPKSVDANSYRHVRSPKALVVL